MALNVRKAMELKVEKEWHDSKVEKEWLDLKVQKEGWQDLKVEGV